MAITFNKNLGDAIYPAYNDSWINFQSSLSANSRAEIAILPPTTFPNRFIIYPDASGTYSFNYKGAARIFMNEYGFADNNAVAIGTGEWGQSIVGLVRKMNSTIYVYNASTSESIDYDHFYYRGVKQIGEQLFDKPSQILQPTINGIDYNLTYFEGYPFGFEMQYLVHSGSQHVKVKNLNTGVLSAEIPTQFSGSFRLVVDKGNGEDWTNHGFLPLLNLVNRLEIYEQSTFRNNINIKKVPNKCGAYLKWLNADGGYSYWLFDQFTKRKLKNKSIGSVGYNAFANVGELTSPTRSIGKTGTAVIDLKTKVDHIELAQIESLFTSPYVQYYTSNNPYVEGQFVNVEFEDEFIVSNKKEFNDVKLSIVLAEMNTMTL